MQLKHIEDSTAMAWEYELMRGEFKMCPRWPEKDCEKLEKGKVWIGMPLEMVIYLHHCRPSEDNISDYGNGRQHQWHFRNGSPSYFYGGDDLIITAYN